MPPLPAGAGPGESGSATDAAAAPPAATPPAALPAWASGETKVKGSNAFLLGGIATGVIALLLVGGGGLWWSMQHPPQQHTSAGPAVAASAASAAAGAASAPPTSPAVPPAATRPVEESARPKPSHPAAGTVRAERPSARTEPPGGAQTFAPVAAPVQSAVSAQTRQPQRSAAPPAPVAPGAEGRVETLRAALAACSAKGNFFTRQLCVQETRWKYCGAPLSPDPLWGKIPECPDSAQQNNP